MGRPKKHQGTHKAKQSMLSTVNRSHGGVIKSTYDLLRQENGVLKPTFDDITNNSHQSTASMTFQPDLTHFKQNHFPPKMNTYAGSSVIVQNKTLNGMSTLGGQSFQLVRFDSCSEPPYAQSLPPPGVTTSPLSVMPDYHPVSPMSSESSYSEDSDSNDTVVDIEEDLDSILSSLSQYSDFNASKSSNHGHHLTNINVFRHVDQPEHQYTTHSNMGAPFQQCSQIRSVDSSSDNFRGMNQCRSQEPNHQFHIMIPATNNIPHSNNNPYPDMNPNRLSPSQTNQFPSSPDNHSNNQYHTISANSSPCSDITYTEGPATLSPNPITISPLYCPTMVKVEEMDTSIEHVNNYQHAVANPTLMYNSLLTAYNIESSQTNFKAIASCLN